MLKCDFVNRAVSIHLINAFDIGSNKRVAIKMKKLWCTHPENMSFLRRKKSARTQKWKLNFIVTGQWPSAKYRNPSASACSSTLPGHLGLLLCLDSFDAIWAWLWAVTTRKVSLSAKNVVANSQVCINAHGFQHLAQSVPTISKTNAHCYAYWCLHSLQSMVSFFISDAFP